MAYGTRPERANEASQRPNQITCYTPLAIRSSPQRDAFHGMFATNFSETPLMQ